MSHHDSSFTYTRRQFWRVLLQEMFITSGSLRGGQAHQISGLSSLPDHQLAQIRPIINPEHEILVDQDQVSSKHRKTGTSVRLCLPEDANLMALNMFDGRNSLSEIARHLSREMNWDEARGFVHVRDLFLALARHLVCVPGNPLEQDGLV